MRRGAWVILLWVVAIAGGGCTQYVTPPSDLAHPVRIFVTDYGKHSSIILPDPSGGYGEFAYGDYAYFALGQKGMSSGIRALVASKGATIGRRHLPQMNNAVEALRVTGTGEIIELSVDGARAESLRRSLESRFGAAGEEPVYNPAARLYFVRDSVKYDLFHTCNHAARHWLEELGCTVRGNAWASRFVVEAK